MQQNAVKNDNLKYKNFATTKMAKYISFVGTLKFKFENVGNARAKIKRMNRFVEKVFAFYLGLLTVWSGAEFFFDPKFNLGFAVRQFVVLSFYVAFISIFMIAPFYYLYAKLNAGKGRFLGVEKSDLCFALFFILACAAFVYWPSPDNFSMSDGLGKIVENGKVTAYGFSVKREHMFINLLCAVGFLVYATLIRKYMKGRDSYV